MRKILMVAYYYPPKGGAGVQRTAKFAKYLASFGYNIHILTVDEKDRGVVDYSLEEDICPGITVHRTYIPQKNLLERLMYALNRGNGKSEGKDNSGHVQKVSAVRSFVRKAGKKIFLDIYNLLYIPDVQKGWTNYAVEEGRKIIRENDIDVIYTTSSPYTSHMIGYKLNREFNIKWVADFRDPWASNPFADYSFIVQIINNNLESKVVKNAHRVVSVSRPIIDDFIRRYKYEDSKKFVVIPNGYDDDDFQGIDLSLSSKNSKFSILYVGTLYGKRSPEKILIGVENLLESNKIKQDSFTIKFMGEIGSAYKQMLDVFTSKYPGIVEYMDYVPHSQSMVELSRANALLLIIDEGRGSEGIYTGKIFEYIRTGKPILGIVPDGVARDLILETGTGYVAYPSNLHEIEDIIYRAYCDFMDGRKDFEPDWHRISQYSRENLAKKLGGIIEDIYKV